MSAARRLEVDPPPPRSGTAAPACRVRVVRGLEAMEPLVPGWEAVAASALEPNVFYEPWMLLPALRGLGGEREIELAAVERDGGELIGVFPLVREERYRGVPAVTLRPWRHDYVFLTTPLVHRAHAAECLHALLDWLRDDSGALLLELAGISGDGAFHHALIEVLNERDEAVFLAERASRGLLRRRDDADAYLGAALDGNARRKLRSKERTLSAAGRVEYAELSSPADAPRWTTEFLSLEEAGWKGRAGTAIAARPGDRSFFETMVVEAARRGRLLMLALRLEGRPIAMKTNFLAGEGSFAFKIAYDEAHGRSSPGMLLELENIRRVHAIPGLSWMDSCAKPSSRLFRELWIDRRTIETLVIPAGNDRGQLLVSLFPLARWMTRRARSSVRAATAALRRRAGS